MSMDIYLEWDGFTDEDRQRRRADVYDVRDPFANGQIGHLEGWRWRDLFVDAFRGSETPARWCAIPGETLMRRLPTVIESITEGHEGPDDPYWSYSFGLTLGFIDRVIQLEAEGRHPMIRVSW